MRKGAGRKENLARKSYGLILAQKSYALIFAPEIVCPNFLAHESYGLIFGPVPPYRSICVRSGHIGSIPRFYTLYIGGPRPAVGLSEFTIVYFYTSTGRARGGFINNENKEFNK